jgi:hypothetical protein
MYASVGDAMRWWALLGVGGRGALGAEGSFGGNVVSGWWNAEAGSREGLARSRRGCGSLCWWLEVYLVGG